MLVAGQLLDDLHLVRLGDAGDDRGAAQEVRSDGSCDLVLTGQFLHRPNLVLVLDLRDDRRTSQQIIGDGGGDLLVLGEGVDRADLLLRSDGFDDLPADPPVCLVRRPAGLTLRRIQDRGEPFLVVGDRRQDVVDRERHPRNPPVLRPLRRGPPSLVHHRVGQPDVLGQAEQRLLHREQRVAPLLTTGLAHRLDLERVVADRELDPAGGLHQLAQLGHDLRVPVRADTADPLSAVSISSGMASTTHRRPGARPGGRGETRPASRPRVRLEIRRSQRVTAIDPVLNGVGIQMRSRCGHCDRSPNVSSRALQALVTHRREQ